MLPVCFARPSSTVDPALQLCGDIDIATMDAALGSYARELCRGIAACTQLDQLLDLLRLVRRAVDGPPDAQDPAHAPATPEGVALQSSWGAVLAVAGRLQMPHNVLVRRFYASAFNDLALTLLSGAHLGQGRSAQDMPHALPPCEWGEPVGKACPLLPSQWSPWTGCAASPRASGPPCSTAGLSRRPPVTSC